MENSEAAFILSSVMEFIRVWRTGNESSLTLDSKDGGANISFKCNLGRPDQPHFQQFQHGRCHVRKKKKSVSRILKNNARAARHQAASRPPPPVPPELPPAEQDRDGYPAKSHQLTTPHHLPHHQPPPRHASPLRTVSLPSSLPSSSGERSQEKKAERVGRRMKRATRVETRSGTRSVRIREEAGEKETTELAPRGAEKVTEEEVTSSQSRPSSHQDRQAMEQKEEKKEDDGVMTPAFWQLQVELQDKLLESIRKRRASSESVKPDKPPDEDHPPPLKRN